MVHKTLEQQDEIPLGPLNKSLAVSSSFFSFFFNAFWIQEPKADVLLVYDIISFFFFLSMIFERPHTLPELHVEVVALRFF